MKTLLKLKLVLLASLFSMNVYAQSDIIFKMNGEQLNVNVTEIGEDAIKFSYPNETLLNSINKNTVSKIEFASGRVQEFAAAMNIVNVKSCLDWENVQISNIESEVSGLQKIDNVTAKAEGVSFASTSKLQDRAYNKAKVQTAMLGGSVLYIVNQSVTQAMQGWTSSQKPSASVSGMAYTASKIANDQIPSGQFVLAEAYKLRTNMMELEKEEVKSTSYNFSPSEFEFVNGFNRIVLNNNPIADIEEYTVSYADDSQVVLYGVSMTKRGKKTYYNLIFNRR